MGKTERRKTGISVEKMQDVVNSKQGKLLGAAFTYNGCPRVSMNIDGSCPVQAFGEIGDANPDSFYFRSRHTAVVIEIYNGENDGEIIYEAGAEDCNASWLSIDKCIAFIGEHINIFWAKQGAFRRIERVWGKAILKTFKARLEAERPERKTRYE